MASSRVPAADPLESHCRGKGSEYRWPDRRQGAQASGHRSCEPVVMFPPPHTLCPVGPDGRFLDLFEQKYGRLDPVFERLSPRNGRASGHRRRPALAP